MVRGKVGKSTTFAAASRMVGRRCARLSMKARSRFAQRLEIELEDAGAEFDGDLRRRAPSLSLGPDSHHRSLQERVRPCLAETRRKLASSPLNRPACRHRRPEGNPQRPPTLLAFAGERRRARARRWCFVGAVAGVDAGFAATGDALPAAFSRAAADWLRFLRTARVPAVADRRRSLRSVTSQLENQFTAGDAQAVFASKQAPRAWHDGR